MPNTWSMTWFDVVRMAENPISPNSFEVIEFKPTKETYQNYNGTPDVLRRGLINSFRASERKLEVRKWIEDEIGDIPSQLDGFQSGGNRWDTYYVKYEIEEEESREETEEDSELDTEELEEDETEE